MDSAPCEKQTETTERQTDRAGGGGETSPYSFTLSSQSFQEENSAALKNTAMSAVGNNIYYSNS